MNEPANDQEDDFGCKDEHQESLSETRTAEIAAQIALQIVHELHLNRVRARRGGYR